MFVAVGPGPKPHGVDLNDSGNLTVTIPHVRATPTTGAVDSTGSGVEYEQTARGLRVNMADADTTHWPVIQLREVDAV